MSGGNIKYRRQLDEAKLFLLETLTGYPNASFVEIEDNFRGADFFREVDDRDKGLTSIAWPGYPNLIIWNADNQFVVDAVKELFEEKKIKLQPADALIYAMDGRLPGMEPITSEIFKKVTKQGYTFKENEFYWVPTIVNIRRQ
jgi:hypothetical protein